MVTVNRPAALGLSALLHGLVLCAGLFVWPWAGAGKPIHVTPITLMTSAQVAPLRPAEQAAEAQEVQTPAPEPAPPAPTPPPKPAPAPVAPTPPPAPPKVAPAAKAAPKAPAPATRVATATGANTRPVNLDSLAKSLAQTAAAKPPTPSGAAKGPTQDEQDLQQRISEGQAKAATANALQAIGAKIADHWNVSCSSASDRNVTVTLRLDLNRTGGLVRAKLENYASLDAIPDPAVRAAAISAISAAQAAAPFSGLPEQTYGDWSSKTYEFRASDVCADRKKQP